MYRNFIGILQAVRQLTAYLIMGLMLCSSPFGWYLLYLLTRINKDDIAMYVWIVLDRLFCVIAHRVKRRTISGWTGQWARKGVKRYVIQAKVINFVMDDKDHCEKAYLWELSKGWVGP